MPKFTSVKPQKERFLKLELDLNITDAVFDVRCIFLYVLAVA